MPRKDFPLLASFGKCHNLRGQDLIRSIESVVSALNNQAPSEPLMEVVRYPCKIENGAYEGKIGVHVTNISGDFLIAVGEQFAIKEDLKYAAGSQVELYYYPLNSDTEARFIEEDWSSLKISVKRIIQTLNKHLEVHGFIK